MTTGLPLELTGEKTKLWYVDASMTRVSAPSKHPLPCRNHAWLDSHAIHVCTIKREGDYKVVAGQRLASSTERLYRSRKVFLAIFAEPPQSE